MNCISALSVMLYIVVLAVDQMSGHILITHKLRGGLKHSDGWHFITANTENIMSRIKYKICPACKEAGKLQVNVENGNYKCFKTSCYNYVEPDKKWHPANRPKTADSNIDYQAASRLVFTSTEKSRGLSSKDIRRRISKFDSVKSLRQKGHKISKLYKYPSMAVVRFEPKTFRQFAIKNGTVKPDLSCLSESEKSHLYRINWKNNKDNEYIIIVEGEKDVRTLHDHGIQATTKPMGANGWNNLHSEQLRRFDRIYDLPDQDDAGLKHMAEVRKNINTVLAKTTETILLPSGYHHYQGHIHSENEETQAGRFEVVNTIKRRSFFFIGRRFFTF